MKRCASLLSLIWAFIVVRKYNFSLFQGNILFCSLDVLLHTTSIPVSSSFHFHPSCLVTEDEGKACPDCIAMSYLQVHWKRWTNGPPMRKCCSHLNHWTHLISLKELLEEYFCHISFQHVFLCARPLTIPHLRKNKAFSYFIFFTRHSGCFGKYRG